MTNRPSRVDATRIGSKKVEFQIELSNRFQTIQELDDIVHDPTKGVKIRYGNKQATHIEDIITTLMTRRFNYNV